MRNLSLPIALLLFSSFAVAQASPASDTVGAKARAIHDSAIIVDTHADTPQRFLDEGFDIGSTDPNDQGHISLDKAKRGNLGAEFFSIWVDPETNQGHYAKHTFDLIDSVYEQAARHPDRLMMAFSVADIERAHREHKLAACMGIEGGHSIENDIHLLRDYYRLGVRYMTLSWSNTNEFADSSGDIDDPKIQHHNGLTDFGKQVVLEMNRLGMMVDISHVADKTFWDAIATTKAPVIASHSSARALTNAPRNMTDEMLKAVAKNGGVVQVNFFNGFIDENFRKAVDAQKPELEAARQKYMDQMKSEGKVVTVGVRGLTRSTTLPGRAATAWRSTVTPRSGQHSTRRTSARSGWGSSATTRAPSRAQQSVRLPTWAPMSKQRSPGRTKRA